MTQNSICMRRGGKIDGLDNGSKRVWVKMVICVPFEMDRFGLGLSGTLVVQNIYFYF